MKPLNPIQADDFEPDIWDVICAARILYTRGSKSAWYRALRTFCGYRGGGTQMKKHMEQIADQWLRAHPSWVATYEAKAGQLTKEYFR